MDGGVALSLADVYRTGAYASFTRTLRHCATPPIVLVAFAQPAGSFPDPPTSDFTLAINDTTGGRMVADVGSGRSVTAFRRGDLMLKPPGVATHFVADAPHAKRFLSLPAGLVLDLLSQAAEGRVRDFTGLCAGPFRSRRIQMLLDAIWAEARQDNPYGPIFTEGALLSLTAVLLRAANPLPPAPRTTARLSESRLRRLEEWVEANLGESFGLSDMAAAIGLSPFHFARALKATTGMTPRALVTQRRVARARSLLASDELPLAEVALACGFADQAHFTHVFGRETVSTPGAWRRSRK
jgi:AraC family transcriptional regulator